MATVMMPVMDAQHRLWQCKQCNQLITGEQTVAYHLVDQVLYGWCNACFSRRGNEPLTVSPATTDYLKSGNDRLARGDVSGALNDYNHAIDANPLLASAYGNRGLVWLIQGKRVEAQKDFQRCLELDSRLKPVLEKRVSEIRQRLVARS
jgi:Tfp pilus assembly protein PilF